MYKLILVISIFMILSCIDNSDDDNPELDKVNVEKSDILGVWHYNYVKYLSPQDTTEYILRDTIDFQEDGNAIWYGFSNKEKYRFELNFYDKYADWNFIKEQNFFFFAGNYPLDRIIGVPYSFMGTYISGTITKFEDDKMIVKTEDYDKVKGYSLNEYHLIKLNKDSTSH